MPEGVQDDWVIWCCFPLHIEHPLFGCLYMLSRPGRQCVAVDSTENLIAVLDVIEHGREAKHT